MKKIISLLAVAVCCFFLATPAQAQLLKWGVKGGLNLAELDTPDGLPIIYVMPDTDIFRNFVR